MNPTESEAIWLRFMLRRLRAAVRRAKESELEAILKELIVEGEERLFTVEQSGRRSTIM